jgi:hypothetical protein
MEPLLAVWSGLYLDGTIIPESELQPYVQDALDELEFIMGDTSTSYGALRTSLGYPSPWKINYVEVRHQVSLTGSQLMWYRLATRTTSIMGKPATTTTAFRCSTMPSRPSIPT